MPSDPSQFQFPGTETTTCIHCHTQLCYPQSSTLIQCPKCQNTMNLSNNYINCAGCHTLLSHPSSSVTIQCPKCMIIMDIGSNSSANSSAGTTKKSRKKRKDPQAPKRASNAYMIFCKERRAKLKEERPDLPFGKLGARLGEMWRMLSAEEKRPYELRASGDRDRYKKEMTSYGAPQSQIPSTQLVGPGPLTPPLENKDGGTRKSKRTAAVDFGVGSLKKLKTDHVIQFLGPNGIPLNIPASLLASLDAQQRALFQQQLAQQTPEQQAAFQRQLEAAQADDDDDDDDDHEGEADEV